MRCQQSDCTRHTLSTHSTLTLVELVAFALVASVTVSTSGQRMNAVRLELSILPPGATLMTGFGPVKATAGAPGQLSSHAYLWVKT